MANFRALTIQSGVTTQIQDANTLIVGTGIDADVGHFLNVGTTNATAVDIGHGSIPLTITGIFTGGAWNYDSENWTFKINQSPGAAAGSPVFWQAGAAGPGAVADILGGALRLRAGEDNGITPDVAHEHAPVIVETGDGTGVGNFAEVARFTIDGLGLPFLKLKGTGPGTDHGFVVADLSIAMLTGAAGVIGCTAQANGLVFLDSGIAGGAVNLRAGSAFTTIVSIGDAAGTPTLSFFGGVKQAKQSIAGVLSAVVDPNAKAVLTSIIDALKSGGTGYSLVSDTTT